jgi:hypothetical protein
MVLTQEILKKLAHFSHLAKYVTFTFLIKKKLFRVINE